MTNPTELEIASPTACEVDKSVYAIELGHELLGGEIHRVSMNLQSDVGFEATYAVQDLGPLVELRNEARMIGNRQLRERLDLLCKILSKIRDSRGFDADSISQEFKAIVERLLEEEINGRQATIKRMIREHESRQEIPAADKSGE